MAQKVAATIAREYKIDRQGKEHVMWAGLLDAAHANIKRIAVTLVQAPADANGHTAICAATVEMDDGRVFSDIGDANAGNTGRTIVPHIIRMASTRAKARALRDALNIGGAALEELNEDDDPAPRQRPVSAEALPDDAPAPVEVLKALRVKAEKVRTATGQVVTVPDGITMGDARGLRADMDKAMQPSGSK